jgi:hypothetical protein
MPLELLKSKPEDLTGFIVAIARQTSANDAGLGQSRFCGNLSGLEQK